MPGEYVKHIKPLAAKELPQLIHGNRRHPHHLPILMIVFGHRQLIERLIIHLELINHKLISKHKSLVVVPDLVHGLNKEVGVVSLNDKLDFRGYVEVDELADMQADALVEVGTLLVGRAGEGEVVDGAIRCK